MRTFLANLLRQPVVQFVVPGALPGGFADGLDENRRQITERSHHDLLACYEVLIEGQPEGGAGAGETAASGVAATSACPGS